MRLSSYSVLVLLIAVVATSGIVGCRGSGGGMSGGGGGGGPMGGGRCRHGHLDDDFHDRFEDNDFGLNSGLNGPSVINPGGVGGPVPIGNGIGGNQAVFGGPNGNGGPGGGFPQDTPLGSGGQTATGGFPADSMDGIAAASSGNATNNANTDYSNPENRLQLGPTTGTQATGDQGTHGAGNTDEHRPAPPNETGTRPEVDAVASSDSEHGNSSSDIAPVPDDVAIAPPSNPAPAPAINRRPAGNGITGEVVDVSSRNAAPVGTMREQPELVDPNDMRDVIQVQQRPGQPR